MAAAAACNAIVYSGLTSSSSSSSSRAAAFPPKKPFLSTVRKPLRVPRATDERLTSGKFEKDWLRSDPSVIGFALIGWVAPSSIPAINGRSLTGLFFHSIGTELAHWPTGPALTSEFWTRVHVPLLSKALISSRIAFRQQSSCAASLNVLGTTSESRVV